MSPNGVVNHSLDCTAAETPFTIEQISMARVSEAPLGEPVYPGLAAAIFAASTVTEAGAFLSPQRNTAVSTARNAIRCLLVC